MMPCWQLTVVEEYSDEYPHVVLYSVVVLVAAAVVDPVNVLDLVLVAVVVVVDCIAPPHVI